MSTPSKTSSNVIDSNERILRKYLSRASLSENEVMRNLCKTAKIALNKVPVVQVEQVDPVIVNTYSEALNANMNKPGSSTAMDAGNRKRHSSERDQDRENRPRKQKLMEDISKLILADKQLNTIETTADQGYVTKEKYVQLMNKYNELQAQYAALQQRFKLTLQLIEASEAENDSEKEDELEEVPAEHEDQQTEQLYPEVLLDYTDNDAVCSVTDDQWRILMQSVNVRQFIIRCMRLLFDKETILTSTVTGKAGHRSRDYGPDQPKPKVLDSAKINTIRVWLERYLDARKFKEMEKKEEIQGMLKHITLYVSSVKTKFRNGFDLSRL